METLSKIVSTILILAMASLIGYKSYTAIKKESDSKLWLVLNKKVVEKAHDCYLDKKCTNKTVTLDYLIQNNYLETITNPVTKEVINKAISPDGLITDDALSVFRLSAGNYPNDIINLDLSS